MSSPNSGEPPGADLGAIWRRKRPKTTQEPILDGFSTDFGWIFMILVDFLMIFTHFYIHFGVDFSTFSRQHVFDIFQKPKALSPATPQTIFQKPWPGGMRVSD